MTAPALSIHGLSKAFGPLVVTRNVDLTLPVGARYALIGPTGAGKTTLVNLMTGMLAANAGRILLGGDDITQLPSHLRVRRGLARTFQINRLFAGLNPLEPIHFPGRRLMTGIWRGEREMPTRASARHATHPVQGVSR